jgi:tetratricopeptide (TPR) repeat protein
MAAPLAALHAAPRLRVAAARFRTSGTKVALAFNLALLTTLLGVSGTALARESTLSEPSPFRVPVESVARLAALPPGDVFGADHHGGYLIWKLYPRFKPYIDTRLVLRSEAEYAEYLGLADFPERFAAFQATHHFSYVLLPVAFPERYQRLIAELYASPDWKLLFTDGSEVLFGRAEKLPDAVAWDLSADATTDAISKSLRERFATSPKLYTAAWLHLATLQALVAETTQAERTLSGLDSAEAQALRARCLFAAGDLERATRLSRELLARDRDDVQSLDLLALIALRRGELVQGATLLHRALGIAPFDSEATGLLAHLQETQR